MEMYIDAYDWVMVPNVYGMSQYADGGMICTKPYISSSNYIRKMSNFEKGDWCEIWDALYWRFIYKHQKMFAKNPRMNMMIVQLNKMDKNKLKSHLKLAESYLKKLK
jgi:deoxyribodipyrimidine photolyase-related protein